MSTAPDLLPPEQRFYEIGGFRILLDTFPFHESEYLAAFRTEGCRVPDLQMTIRAVETVSVPEAVEAAEVGETVFADAAGREVRICKTDRKDGILYRITRTGPGALLAEITQKAAPQLGSFLVLRWLDLPGFLLERGALLLHASLIRWRGRAIAFTGRKQIGKSTQAELWRRCRGARVLNGDRALLRRLDGVWTACGSPFCGTSDICLNEKAPVEAIVLLAQGPENRTEPADLKAAYAAFLSGCAFDARNGEATERVITLAEQIRAEVPMLRLTCTPDERAVQCLEEALIREV